MIAVFRLVFFVSEVSRRLINAQSESAKIKIYIFASHCCHRVLADLLF